VLQDTLNSSLSRVVGRYCYDDWTNQLQKFWSFRTEHFTRNYQGLSRAKWPKENHECVPRVLHRNDLTRILGDAQAVVSRALWGGRFETRQIGKGLFAVLRHRCLFWCEDKDTVHQWDGPAVLLPQCRLWIKSRYRVTSAPCPLYPHEGAPAPSGRRTRSR